jgi:DNA (cytosine-5)-methyltransferase 1
MPTHTASPESDQLFDLHPHITVRETIGDLPSVRHDAGSLTMDDPSGPGNEFQKMMRKGCAAASNHKPRTIQPLQYQRQASLKPGDGLKQLPEHIRPRSG